MGTLLSKEMAKATMGRDARAVARAREILRVVTLAAPLRM